MLGIILIPVLSYGLPRVVGPEDEGFIWTNIEEPGIRGKGWVDDPIVFNRLPAKAESYRLDLENVIKGITDKI